MAVRRWKVHPHPDTGVVDRQELFEAVADAVVMVDRAGGVMSLAVARAATDLPGEMVTTLAVVEWKDRSDAKPQPERPTSIEPAIPQPGLFESTAEDDEAPPVPDSPDGLDESQLEDEDVSAIPEAMR